MIVYLCGPMRGYPKWNFPAFDETKDRIIKEKSWKVISPADMDRAYGFDPSSAEVSPVELRAALNRDLAVIINGSVDALVLLHGWERSAGALAEVALAKCIGLTFYNALTLLPVIVKVKGAVIYACD